MGEERCEPDIYNLYGERDGEEGKMKRRRQFGAGDELDYVKCDQIRFACMVQHGHLILN